MFLEQGARSQTRTAARVDNLTQQRVGFAFMAGELRQAQTFYMVPSNATTSSVVEFDTYVRAGSTYSTLRRVQVRLLGQQPLHPRRGAARYDPGRRDDGQAGDRQGHQCGLHAPGLRQRRLPGARRDCGRGERQARRRHHGGSDSPARRRRPAQRPQRLGGFVMKRLDRHRLARPLLDQRGTTLIELMVVVMVITVGLIAVVSVLDQATKTAVAAQRHQTAIQIGQREIEKLKDISYHEPGPRRDCPPAPRRASRWATPAPRTRTSTSAGQPVPGQEQLPQPEQRPAAGRQHQRRGAGDPEHGGPGDGRPRRPAPELHGRQGFGRGVALRDLARGELHQLHGPRLQAPHRRGQAEHQFRHSCADKPIWVTSVFADPEATPPGVPPPGGPSVSAQPFYLYDTPCSGLRACGPDRQPRDPQHHPGGCHLHGHRRSQPDVAQRATRQPATERLLDRRRFARIAPGCAGSG